jgi:hypothetical protein
MKAKSGSVQGGSPGWSKVAPYAALSLATFVCASILPALLLWKPEKLVALGLTGYLYYLVLLPFGLLAAAFLFGALRPSASYRGKQFGGILELGGPVGAMAPRLMVPELKGETPTLPAGTAPQFSVVEH